jgi:Tfp pilus assembly protein PilN
MSDDRQNGWNEYSRLVLNQLETLADSIDSLRTELQEMKQEIAKMQVREDKVEDLRQWKDRIDDVVSPTQLREIISSLEELKTFKTKAITIFAVVQFGMAASIWLMKFL